LGVGLRSVKKGGRVGRGQRIERVELHALCGLVREIAPLIVLACASAAASRGAPYYVWINCLGDRNGGNADPAGGKLRFGVPGGEPGLGPSASNHPLVLVEAGKTARWRFPAVGTVRQ